MLSRASFVLAFVLLTPASAQNTPKVAWQTHCGVPGPTGWRCHIIQPDPDNDGPDGINLHDWDGDGDLDLFANAEEGKYSRLYFHPGRKLLRECWDDFIEFHHGQCEDSGMGDLDNDGDVDYVANGGRVYFNPGKDKVRDTRAWTTMVLFEQERRVPTVFDVDGDGLNDLIVGAQEWYKQPATQKHNPASWKKYVIGTNRWPMNCIMMDVDKDGDVDMVVPDRGIEICWFDNPGLEHVTEPWQRKTLHPHTEPMFMAVADVNGDEREDFVITGGNKGKHAKKLLVLLRTNDSGNPEYQEIVIAQPCGLFPKGVAIADFDGDPARPEILIIPKSGDVWTAAISSKNGGEHDKLWTTSVLAMPGAESRKKMDNAWLGDLDGDGDLDVVTTEENGGWGVIWFENPLR